MRNRPTTRCAPMASSEQDALARIDRADRGLAHRSGLTAPRRQARVAVVPPLDVALIPSGAIADAIYGLRLLRAKPGYAAVTILTIALGVGAVTTLFSVAYGVLLRPLPWGNTERLVRLTETRGGRAGTRAGHDDERQLPRLGRCAADTRGHRVLQRRKPGDADRGRRGDADSGVARHALDDRAAGRAVRFAGESSKRPKADAATISRRGPCLVRIVGTTLRPARRHRWATARARRRATHDRRCDAARVQVSERRNARLDRVAGAAGRQPRRHEDRHDHARDWTAQTRRDAGASRGRGNGESDRGARRRSGRHGAVRRARAHSDHRDRCHGSRGRRRAARPLSSC